MQVQKPGLGKKGLLEAGLRQAGAKPGACIQDAGTLANKQTIKRTTFQRRTKVAR